MSAMKEYLMDQTEKFLKNLLTFAYHKCYTFGKQKVVMIWSPKEWADLLTRQSKRS